jgi:hypothetical protein
LVVLVIVQLSVLGLYLPPVFNKLPPHTTISLPVHTAVCEYRAEGALAMLIHVFVLGSYLPPVFERPELSTPPHTIVSLPVQTAV